MTKGSINIRQQRNRVMKGKLSKAQRLRRVKAHRKATAKWYKQSGKEYYREYYERNKQRISEIQWKYSHSKKGKEAIARYESQTKRVKQKAVNQQHYRDRKKAKGKAKRGKK